MFNRLFTSGQPTDDSSDDIVSHSHSQDSQESQEDIMDADTLKAILKDHQDQMKQIQLMVAETLKKPADNPGTSSSTNEFVTNSLVTRLPVFSYDPENGGTFEAWYNRYEDILCSDGVM